MKRFICILMIAGLVFSLAACGEKSESVNEPTAVTSPTIPDDVFADEGTFPREDVTSVLDATDENGNGSSGSTTGLKAITKMGDYLNDPSVKAAYDAVAENTGEIYKAVKFYAADDSTAVFEYVFEQTFSGSDLETVKNKLASQESSMLLGAKAAISEFERETSISDPKIEYRYLDGANTVLYDHIFTKSEVSD